jgi:hypothetical protein
MGGDFAEVSGDPWFPARGLARWIDGGSRSNQWRSLNVGPVSVRALRGFEGRLFVGGRFAGIGGATSANVAELSATSNWLSFGTGVSSANPSDVAAIEPFGSGIPLWNQFYQVNAATDGRDLYLSTPSLQRWDGRAWLPVGEGGPSGPVEVSGTNLFAVGLFAQGYGVASTDGEHDGVSDAVES